MRRCSVFATVAVASVLLVFASTQPAHAYIDPGSGSFVLQMLGMFLVGTLYYFRQFLFQTVGFLKSLRTKILGRPAIEQKASDNSDQQ